MAYANIGAVFTAPLAERAAGPSVFRLILNALEDSRRKAAQREINARRHLFEGSSAILGDLPASTLESDARLPFSR
jgi:hypothetical protein